MENNCEVKKNKGEMMDEKKERKGRKMKEEKEGRKERKGRKEVEKEVVEGVVEKEKGRKGRKMKVCKEVKEVVEGVVEMECVECVVGMEGVECVMEEVGKGVSILEGEVDMNGYDMNDIRNKRLEVDLFIHKFFPFIPTNFHHLLSIPDSLLFHSQYIHFHIFAIWFFSHSHISHIPHLPSLFLYFKHFSFFPFLFHILSS